MAEEWLYQVRIDLPDAVAAVARKDPDDPAIAPLAECRSKVSDISAAVEDHIRNWVDSLGVLAPIAARILDGIRTWRSDVHQPAKPMAVQVLRQCAALSGQCNFRPLLWMSQVVFDFVFEFALVPEGRALFPDVEQLVEFHGGGEGGAEPQPKFVPATRTSQAADSGRFSAKSGSGSPSALKRRSWNKAAPRPSRVVVVRNRAGMI